MAQEIGRACHAHCYSRPRIRRGSARANLAGILHAIPTNFADGRKWSAVASPDLPPTPIARPLHPQGAALDATPTRGESHNQSTTPARRAPSPGGEGWGEGGRKPQRKHTAAFTAFFRYALPAVRSHRPPVCAQSIRGVLGGSPLKTTPHRKPRRRSLPSKGDGNGTAIIKKKP